MTDSKRATILAMYIAVLFAARSGAQSIVVQPRVSTGLQDYQLHSDDVIAPLLAGGTDIRGAEI